MPTHTYSRRYYWRHVLRGALCNEHFELEWSNPRNRIFLCNHRNIRFRKRFPVRVLCVYLIFSNKQVWLIGSFVTRLYQALWQMNILHVHIHVHLTVFRDFLLGYFSHVSERASAYSIHLDYHPMNHVVIWNMLRFCCFFVIEIPLCIRCLNANRKKGCRKKSDRQLHVVLMYRNNPIRYLVVPHWTSRLYPVAQRFWFILFHHSWRSPRIWKIFSRCSEKM